jgi:hypothetical protein
LTREGRDRNPWLTDSALPAVRANPSGRALASRKVYSELIARRDWICCAANIDIITRLHHV